MSHTPTNSNVTTPTDYQLYELATSAALLRQWSVIVIGTQGEEAVLRALHSAADCIDHSATIITALRAELAAERAVLPAMLAQARRDALEEAAKLVDDFRRDPAHAGLGCDAMIAAIRALAASPPTPAPVDGESATEPVSKGGA